MSEQITGNEIIDAELAQLSSLNEVNIEPAKLMEHLGNAVNSTSISKTAFLEYMHESIAPVSLFFTRYKCALMEIETKFDVLNSQLSLKYDSNPIESIKTRIKSFESIIGKVERYGLTPSLDAIEENIQDIAGVRVICAFQDDIYKLAKCFLDQDDVILIQKKDYIANPKPSGYRSLHLIVKTPIFLKEGKKMITVEVQLRTIAMDFWASLEHKLRYKKSIPEDQSKYLAEEMMDCAQISSALDERMQKVRDVIMQAEEKEEEKSSGVEPLMLRGLTERIRQKNL